MTDSYAKLYHKNEWKAKRLEILADAGFACEFCKEHGENLHVHHWWYGKTPWETCPKPVWWDDYHWAWHFLLKRLWRRQEPSQFSCVCKGCHEVVEVIKKAPQPIATLIFGVQDVEAEYNAKKGGGRNG